MTSALLSRVAESTYWIGRYLERAEGAARILDVIVYQALEQSGSATSDAATRLLAVMGISPTVEADADLWTVTERLANDRVSRSSIAGALGAARENTRAVRHVVPVELWERVNATWEALPAQWELARRVGPGRRHVEVARGRDYADVAPLRGVYAGVDDIASSVTVTVTITRVA